MERVKSAWRRYTEENDFNKDAVYCLEPTLSNAALKIYDGILDLWWIQKLIIGMAPKAKMGARGLGK